MKPAPAPDVLGKTEAERMSSALRKVPTVPKRELAQKEARLTGALMEAHYQPCCVP